MKKSILFLALMIASIFGAQAAEKKVYTSYNSSTKTLTYYYDDQYGSHASVEYYKWNGLTTRWESYHDEVEKVVIDDSMKDADLPSLDGLFCGSVNQSKAYLSNVTEIENLSALNTANVTSMVGMFQGCKSLTSLDLRTFNTANVTKMSAMFQDCESLLSLDLSGFKTAEVTHLRNMFQNCKTLTSLDIRLFNTSQVTDVSGMFQGCIRLKTIYCNTDLSQNTSLSSTMMFSGCTNLVGGKGTKYDSSHTDATYARPDEGKDSDHPGYFTGAEKDVYTVFDGVNKLTYYYDDQYAKRSGRVEFYDPENNPDAQRWESYHNEVEKVVIDASMKKAPLTSMESMFYGGSMNNGVIIIYSLDNMTSIIGLNNLNTGIVTNMKYMFGFCRSLESLNISQFNTSNVTNMFGMFGNCEKLQSLDVSQFKTDKVIEMSYMFTDCKSLTSLDLSSFNTDKVELMHAMFEGCSSLTSLDLSSFNTANVEYMHKMFEGCVSLTSLDLSSFNTAKVESMYKMFNGCSSLKTIYCNDDWSKNTTIKRSEDMFSGCTQLKGGKGTQYNSSIFDKTYARLDEGPDSDHPGYFTAPVTCAAPSNLTADAEYNGATITWEAGSNNSQWMVYIRESNQSDFTYLTTTYSKSYEVDGLEIGKLYVVRVKSLCGYSEGEEATVVFKTKKSAPVPTNVKVSDVTNHAATIDWTPGDDKQDKWDVTLNDGFHDELFQVTKHPITFSNLVAETHYTVKVRGYNNGVKSDWSSEVTFNTDLDPDAEIYAAKSGATMTIYFDNRKLSRSGVLSKWTPGSGASNMSDADLAAIQSATIDASMQNAAPGSLERWFNNMSNLQSVSGIENLNTSRATTMVAMFNECTSLSSLNLSNFETSNVVYMNDMFSGCTNLQTLDLTNFTTTKVQDMSYMFYGCSALTTIVCDNDWSMASAASGSMFLNCTSLQGGRGTVYNENETSRWYAHPDGGVSNPGYFTSYKTSEEDLAAAKADLMQWITLAMEVGEVLRKSGETEGAQSVINAVDNAMTVYSDDEATLEEIDAQMQALETELSRWTDAVLAYYQQLMIAKLQDLLEEGDSEACQKIIADAIETINEVTWDDSKNFADALARLEKTMDEIYQEAKIRLFAQRKADEATAIDEVSIQPSVVSCQKILRDGQIFILRGDKVYTITGQEVR